MMKLAKETGLTREALYRMLSEDGNPTLDTLLKIAKAIWAAPDDKRGLSLAKHDRTATAQER